MITVEEKLDIFHKIVFRDEEAKYQRLLEELDDKNKQLLEDKRAEMELQREEIIRRKIAQGKIEKNEALAKAKEDIKTQLLQKRADLQKDLLERVLNKAKRFVETEEYNTYLCKKLDKYLMGLEEKDMILYLREKDVEGAKHCLENLEYYTKKTFKIEPLDEDYIAGFMISDLNKTYNIDHTVRTLIEENEYLIGKELCLALGKAGETNE